MYRPFSRHCRLSQRPRPHLVICSLEGAIPLVGHALPARVAGVGGRGGGVRGGGGRQQTAGEVLHILLVEED